MFVSNELQLCDGIDGDLPHVKGNILPLNLGMPTSIREDCCLVDLIAVLSNNSCSCVGCAA